MIVKNLALSNVQNIKKNKFELENRQKKTSLYLKFFCSLNC